MVMHKFIPHGVCLIHVYPHNPTIITINITMSSPCGHPLWPSSVASFTTVDSIVVASYIDLGLPVPLGPSGDEKSPSVMVTGDPVGSMPTDTHLFRVFFECASSCLLWPPFLSSANCCF